MNRKLMLLAILVAAILVTMKFNQSNPVLVLTITWGVFFLYKKIYQIPDDKKIRVIAFIYTLLLSFAVIIGSQVNYVSIRSKMNENFIGINSFSVVGAILLAFLLYPAIVFLISQIEKHSFKDNSVCVSTRNLKFFLIAWIIIFSFWVPYLLSFYPAGIVGDGACTLEYSIQEGIPDHNHWVILYILVLRLFLKIGSIFNADINFGIFLYAIVESLLFSAVCALVVMTLREKGIPEKWVWSSVALYALSGFFASYSMVLWKDGLFAAGVVLLVLLLWDYPEKGIPSLRYCLLYGGLCLFLFMIH